MFPPGEAQAVMVKAEAKSKAISVLSEALTQQVKTSCCFFNEINVIRDFSVHSDHFIVHLCRMGMQRPL